MKKILNNKIFKFIYGLLKFIIFAILIIYVALLIFQRFSSNGSIMGYRIYTIATGSMEPTLEVGDVILVTETPYEELKIQDIITYESKAIGTEGMIITHRIIDINSETKEIQTKGDANDASDPIITGDQVYGRVTYKFIIISLLTKIIRTKTGFYFLIFIPLVVVIFLEAADIITKPKDEEEKDEETSK